MMVPMRCCISLLFFIEFLCVNVIPPPAVLGSINSKKYSNKEIGQEMEVKSSQTSKDKDEHAKRQKNTACKNCKQFPTGGIRTEDRINQQHTHNDGYFEFDKMVQTSTHLKTSTDSITRDSSTKSSNSVQKITEKSVETGSETQKELETDFSYAKKPSTFVDNTPKEKHPTLTTEEKLQRLLKSRKSRNNSNALGKRMRPKSGDSQANVGKEITEYRNQLSTIFKNSELDSFNILSSDTTLDHPVESSTGTAENVRVPERSYLAEEPQIQKPTPNVLRKGNENASLTHTNSFQLFDNKMSKLNNQSSLLKGQHKSNASTKLSGKNTKVTLSIPTPEHKNMQELSRSKRKQKTQNAKKPKVLHQGPGHGLWDRDNPLSADVTKDYFISDSEWRNEHPGNARQRAGFSQNRLVRPSDADRLEQHILPDLRRSYHHLRDNLHRILRIFAESLQNLKSYNAEIFNGTRYEIMIGARHIFEKLYVANNYIYDGVMSATQFTREVMMKYHRSHNSQIPGRLQEPSLESLQSKLVSRNFESQLQMATEEHRNAEAEMKKIKLMKMQCIQNEAHLKQIKEMFYGSYDRLTFRDLYDHLNTSIMQMNRGLHISPQLRELKRIKVYVDNTKAILATSKNLLMNSHQKINSGFQQLEEHYDKYHKWQQDSHFRHRLHGSEQRPHRSSESSLTSGQFGKLQQLVIEATEHANKLQQQQSRLESMFGNSINKTKAAVTKRDRHSTFDLKSVSYNLKHLLKDLQHLLDMIRIDIESKTQIIPLKTCGTQIEGSGMIDSNDDMDLCGEEGSGFESPESEKVFVTDDEDFTFTDEPLESTSPPVKKPLQGASPPEHSLKQFGIDLTDFTSKLLNRSKKISDNVQNFQLSVTGLQKRWNNSESSLYVIENSVDTQKYFVLDLENKTRNFQEVRNKIQEISQKVAMVKTFDLEKALEKAKQAADHAKTQKQPHKIADMKDVTRQRETSKEASDYSDLIKQGQEIASKFADFKILKSMAIENCGKFGSRFTYIESNMSLLRQKVDKAREMLSSLQLSILKSGSGHISLPIPQTYPEAAKTLITSIKVCVKPKSLDGTLLVVTGNNSASYSIALDGGEVVVTTFKENVKIATLTLDQKLVAEQWYTLEVQRTAETLSLTAISQTSNMQIKRQTVTSIELLQPLPLVAYIGGVPQSLGMNGESWEGCIGELLVNGRALTLIGKHSEGAKPSLCTDHCISDQQKLSIVLSGNGFAHFIRPQRERTESVTLKFRTHQKTASLLSIVSRSQNFYLQVTLVNGALKVESSSPMENIVLLSLNSSMNDGQSHLLKITYRGSKTYPELDGNGKTFSVERAAPQIFKEVLNGVLVGAYVTSSRQFLKTPYRPFIGCISDISINDDRLSLPDAADIYNIFQGNCKASSLNIWQSCWQWADSSLPLSLGLVDNSNIISLLVSRDARGPLIHFIKEGTFDIEVTLTSDGIDVSSGDSEGVLIRPKNGNSHFTSITVTDEGNKVTIKAWDQSVSLSYGGFWGFARKDLAKPHVVVLGESRGGGNRLFTGSISQLTIGGRFYDLSQFNTSNLSVCERPLEKIPPTPGTIVQRPFSCV